LKKSKGWSGSSIRKLARQRVQAEIEGAQKASLTSSCSDDVNFASRKGFKATPPNNASPEFLWGRFEKSYGDNVLIVVLDTLVDSGEEMGRLCSTLGLDCVDRMIVKAPNRISAATYLGQGRLEGIKSRVDALGVSAVAFELPLSPVQVRNLEDELGVPVLDREGVILSIFKHHARTSLAKIQVELAQLKYLQSRLSGIWSGLSRQSGGGKGGVRSRGQGETRLELDRRVIKDRISILNKRLKSAEKSVDTQSSKRSSLPRAALVGYTNAGKTTLMKRLTRANLLEENKLFSTLDTTVRVMNPPTDPKILISDTVGFVRDLPHDLVHSFKSTLQEAVSSRVLIHVLDLSHIDWRDQFESTESVLEEIGASGVERVFVLNKMDRVEDAVLLKKSAITRYIKARFPDSPIFMLSARTGEGVDSLKAGLQRLCSAKEPEWSVAL